MTICLVTDRRRLSPGGDEQAAAECLLRQIGEALEAGIDLIQVRERDLEARALTALVARIVERAHGFETRVVVNERVDVARAAGAHGVHLRRDSLSIADARQIAPAGFLVGRSVGSVEQAEAAGDADYLIAGTVWDSPSKPEGHRRLGVADFAAIAARVDVPVLAIGGVTAERAREVARAGGRGVAAIGAFMSGASGGACRAMPLSEVVHRFRRSFDTPAADS